MSLLPLRDTARVGAAVIGTGFIAAVHMDALRRIGVPLRGVLTRDAGAARATGEYPHVYDDLDALCADTSVDVVHVTSPNHLHAGQVTQLIAAGKHVVCEKPLALTADEGIAMLRAAEAAGIVHAICFNVRFNPVLHEARAMVARGDLGAAAAHQWRLPAGLAPARHRLELAGRPRRLRPVARRRRHRLALARPGPLRDGAARRRGRSPTCIRPCPSATVPTGSVETFTGKRSARRSARTSRSPPTTRRGCCCVSRAGHAGSCTVSQVVSRPQEPLHRRCLRLGQWAELEL